MLGIETTFRLGESEKPVPAQGVTQGGYRRDYSFDTHNCGYFHRLDVLPSMRDTVRGSRENREFCCGLSGRA